MKKARKLGLQSLALVLMAFVLVAGVAFGMTGAWFQDSAKVDDQTITMGNHVVIGLSGETYDEEAHNYSLTRTTRQNDEGTYAMPGDVYTFNGLEVQVDGAHAEMYVVVKTTIGASGTFTHTITEQTGWEAFDDPSMAGFKFRRVAAGEEGVNLKVYNHGTLTVNSALGNEVAGQSISITAKAWAIQTANIVENDAAFKALTLEQINGIFDDTTTYATAVSAGTEIYLA